MLTLDKLITPLTSSMVGLIPVLINITVNWLNKKSPEPGAMPNSGT